MGNTSNSIKLEINLVEQSDNVSQELHTILSKMQQTGGVEIKKRTYHLKNYPPCFISAEAIAWMIDSNLAKDIEDAVKKGEELRNLGLIQHVADADKSFEDGNLFFRINQNEKKMAHQS